MRCARPRCKCACHRTKIAQPTPTDQTPVALATMQSSINQTGAILLAIRAELPDIVRRANDDSDEGHKAVSLQPPVSNGNSDPDLFTRAFRPIGKPDENGDQTWIAKTDVVRSAYARIVAELERASRAAAAAYDELPALRGLTEAEARKELERLAPSCLNCGTVVTEVGDDRLRAGRCSPCYRYWDRHDRAEERPKDLWS